MPVTVEYQGYPHDFPAVRMSRRVEADRYTRRPYVRVELSVRHDPAAGWFVFLDSDEAEMPLYADKAAATAAYEALVHECADYDAQYNEHAWTETDVPGVPVHPGPVPV